MARNASGVYSLPNSPVVSGTTITAADENTTRSDMASELTNSLDRNGRGAMLAPLALLDGALATPGLTFGADTNTGIYRSAVDTMVLVAGATAIATITTAGISTGLAFSVTSGGISVTGNSTITGTLGGVTALTASTISAPSGSLSIASPVVLSSTLDTGSTGQIIFPAPQNPSAGANTLDDYEEGTWTPSVGGSATYAAQVGKYTKIGNLVFVSFDLAISTIGTGSTTVVTGLPFTANASIDFGLSVGSFANISTSIVCLIPTVLRGTTQITLFSLTAAAAGEGTSAIFKNGAEVQVAGCYIV